MNYINKIHISSPITLNNNSYEFPLSINNNDDDNVMMLLSSFLESSLNTEALYKLSSYDQSSNICILSTNDMRIVGIIELIHKTILKKIYESRDKWFNEEFTYDMIEKMVNPITNINESEGYIEIKCTLGDNEMLSGELVDKINKDKNQSVNTDLYFKSVLCDGSSFTVDIYSKNLQFINTDLGKDESENDIVDDNANNNVNTSINTNTNIGSDVDVEVTEINPLTLTNGIEDMELINLNLETNNTEVYNIIFNIVNENIKEHFKNQLVNEIFQKHKISNTYININDLIDEDDDDSSNGSSNGNSNNSENEFVNLF